MAKRTPRLLLLSSALILAAGGVLHGLAYAKAQAALNSSNLPTFYVQACKGLWLIDSATLLILTAVFGFVAARPARMPAPLIVLIALIPAATAALLYLFLGGFFAAHMLLAASLAAITAGVQLSGVRAAKRATPTPRPA